MSSEALKIAFDNALIEVMREYRRKICVYRFGIGYNKLSPEMQDDVDMEVGKTFANAIRILVSE